MKIETKIVALGAACAACCALPVASLLLPGALFAGSALASLGLKTLEWSAGLTVAGVVVFLLLRRWRSPRTSSGATIDDGCGCVTAKSAAQPGRAAELAPIACTLTPGDFKERVKWIRDLARESLRDVRREPLALHLHYDATAAERVREMVHKEEACCAFLRFDLSEDARGAYLTITAPEEAREAAHELFAHFAPELARAQSLTSSTQKESV